MWKKRAFSTEIRAEKEHFLVRATIADFPQIFTRNHTYAI